MFNIVDTVNIFPLNYKKIKADASEDDNHKDRCPVDVHRGKTCRLMPAGRIAI
jgi:hypothetical protein